MKTRIFPVIHVLDEQQVIHNVKIASNAKADGVFLISHDSRSSPKDLISLSLTAKGLIPWVGINFLGLSALEAMKIVPPWIDGLWTDNAGIGISAEQLEAQAIQTEQKRRSWPGAHFGGVAFKYQEPVKDVALAAQIASSYIDVVTTSGPGTGRAADIDKIQKMREAMPSGSRLAIASGITPENIGNYLPHVTDFLVATGIGKDFHNLDSSKLHSLVAASGN